MMITWQPCVQSLWLLKANPLVKFTLCSTEIASLPVFLRSVGNPLLLKVYLSCNRGKSFNSTFHHQLAFSVTARTCIIPGHHPLSTEQESTQRPSESGKSINQVSLSTTSQQIWISHTHLFPPQTLLLLVLSSIVNKPTYLFTSVYSLVHFTSQFLGFQFKRG